MEKTGELKYLGVFVKKSTLIYADCYDKIMFGLDLKFWIADYSKFLNLKDHKYQRNLRPLFKHQLLFPDFPNLFH